jgi:hypothetical protein
MNDPELKLYEPGDGEDHSKDVKPLVAAGAMGAAIVLAFLWIRDWLF